MSETQKGTFHFHSTYSHDGRSTLKAIASTLRRRGYSFCIMTEHFEDFDEAAFARYVQEVHTVSQHGGFLLIPGVEVNLAGLDTVLFPAYDYAELMRFASNGSQSSMFSVLVHPSKYPVEAILRHLKQYDIDGLELWNQEADTHYLPPVPFVEWVKTQPWRDEYHYLFGCDIHDVRLNVANILAVTAPLSPEAIVSAMKAGRFISKNLTTSLQYDNDGTHSFDAWVDAIRTTPFRVSTMRATMRQTMRSFYKRLPRHTQHSLNDFKNFVRNKL